MTSTSPIYWDPFDREIAANPYPIYERMRAEAPLWYNERHDFYPLCLGDDIDAALKDGPPSPPAGGPILEVIKATVETPRGPLLREAPPIHDLHRKLLSSVFTP